jgi:hypothetical protein
MIHHRTGIKGLKVQFLKIQALPDARVRVKQHLKPIIQRKALRMPETADAPTHARRLLNEPDLVTGRLQFTRRNQTRKPCTDNEDIGTTLSFTHNRHGCCHDSGPFPNPDQASEALQTRLRPWCRNQCGISSLAVR